MKNRLPFLAAALLGSAAALPAQATGYTIYEDGALPSVLFIEFDNPGNQSDAVISAPPVAGLSGDGIGVDLGGAPVGPPQIGEEFEPGGAPDDSVASNADDTNGGESSDEQASSDEDDFGEAIDQAMTIDDDRLREVVIDHIVADEILSDVELR